MIEKKYEIRRGEIDVTHENKTITFMYKQYGPGTYAEVARSVDKDGLVKPTLAETVSLVYPSFFAEKEEFSKIEEIIKDKWLWSSTGVLYVPGEGAYIQDNLDGLFMDESELIKKRKSGDPSVRFVPFGFKTGELATIEITENEFIIALVREEGAKKLEEIASKHEYNLHLRSQEYVDDYLMAVASLGSVYEKGKDMFDIIGNNDSSFHGGSAFGIKS